MKNKKSIVWLFINCIISIFSLCFLIDIYSFFDMTIKDDMLEKFIFIIIFGLAITFILALRFSFFSYLKLLAEKYNLLLILGIKTKDFWKLAVKEYFSNVFFLGLKTIIISNIICIMVSCIIFLKNNIDLKTVIKQFLSTTILVFLLYVFILILTMMIIMYNGQKKELIAFFEHFHQVLSNNHKKKHKVDGIPILGAFLIIFSFGLLIDFKVDKMIIAVFLNIIGAFLLINSNGSLLKKVLKKFKRIYYKKLLILSDLFYQYSINSHLIIVLYILNFILVYFMGGLIVSVNSDQDNILKYPYETIIYSDRNVCPQYSYNARLLDIMGYGSVTAISDDDYNYFTGTDIDLEEGKVLFLDEREKEADLPLDENVITITNSGNDGKQWTYYVKKAEWKVVFGQNIFQELQGIVVLNNKDFDSLLEDDIGVKKFIFLSDHSIDRDQIKLEAGDKYWSRTNQVVKDRMENQTVITLLYTISLLLILEGQAFIFTKQIVNFKEESYRYNILKQLGIKKEELSKIIEKKVKGILLLPAVMALVSGIIFFAMDICQEPGGFTILTMADYGIAILIFALIQMIGCYLISNKMKKIYIGE